MYTWQTRQQKKTLSLIQTPRVKRKGPHEVVLKKTPSR